MVHHHLIQEVPYFCFVGWMRRTYLSNIGCMYGCCSASCAVMRVKGLKSNNLRDRNKRDIIVVHYGLYFKVKAYLHQTCGSIQVCVPLHQI